MEQPAEFAQAKLERARTTDISHSNFDFLYDSFHQPLTDIISNEGHMIGINKKGELKCFEHSEETRGVETALRKYAREWNSELLDLNLAQCFARCGENLSDTMKYILSFYKVLALRG
eukprot:TRINITY_DN10404_c0_g1_i3.p2 TRINITY_DN10404_c0_g1~~TRINITY_DN10404_c0_g1_i3.p2  ORF type:complete len:117 (-),score=31.81 TRINITY_DN10404_c0_g1_i3:848-1198(-)